MSPFLLVQFLRTTPAEFAAAMNHFSNVVDGRTDYYQWNQKDIADAGVNLLPKFALGATLLAAPIGAQPSPQPPLQAPLQTCRSSSRRQRAEPSRWT